MSHSAAGEAWDTPLAVFSPVMGEREVGGLSVHSVVLQVPLEGKEVGVRDCHRSWYYTTGICSPAQWPYLDCLLRSTLVPLHRADGTPPEWVKPSDHEDFHVSFREAIAVLEEQRALKAGGGGVGGWSHVCGHFHGHEERCA
jgi:hypothetical protein